MKAAGASRLFLALWPDCTRVALARCRDAWALCADAVPERTEKLHMTLHFLGAVPQQRLPELIDGLRVSFSRFTLHLDCAQRWPNGVAVLTPKTVLQALLALHAALCDGRARATTRHNPPCKPPPAYRPKVQAAAPASS